MIRIPTPLRTLAAASALALAVAAIATGGADAKPKRADTCVRCALSGSVLASNPDNEDIVFFLPYDPVAVQDTQGNIHVLTCGTDGLWHVGGSAIRPGVTLPLLQPVVIAR